MRNIGHFAKPFRFSAGLAFGMQRWQQLVALLVHTAPRTTTDALKAHSHARGTPVLNVKSPSTKRDRMAML